MPGPSALSTPTPPTPPSAPDPALATALRRAYTTTLAALDPKVTDAATCERHDAEATAGLEAFREAVEARSSALPEALRRETTAFLERLDAAQLRIMAFAINRKNRGEADSAETEAERRERAQFRRDAGPAYEALRSVFGDGDAAP
ncbi:MAG: hypothetical protein NVS2B3_12770 [Vulcanimicrobiaceae bacterium]